MRITYKLQTCSRIKILFLQMYLDTNVFILKTYLDTKYFSEKVSRYEDTWSDKLDNLADKKNIPIRNSG